MTTAIKQKKSTQYQTISGHILCEAIPPNFPICSVSKGYCDLTGYQPEEIIGLSSNFLQGPNTQPDIINNIRRAINKGESFSGNIINYRKDGTQFSNQLTIEPIYNAKGEITHFMGIQSGKIHINKAQIFTPNKQPFTLKNKLKNKTSYDTLSIRSSH